MSPARPCALPQRAIRTAQFLYIRNFRPERWPMGRLPASIAPGPWPQMTQLGQNTFAAFGDFDASPTKAFLTEARNRPNEGLRRLRLRTPTGRGTRPLKRPPSNGQCRLERGVSKSPRGTLRPTRGTADTGIPGSVKESSDSNTRPTRGLSSSRLRKPPAIEDGSDYGCSSRR